MLKNIHLKIMVDSLVEQYLIYDTTANEKNNDYKEGQDCKTENEIWYRPFARPGHMVQN